ncbi:pyridoxal-dependent decarboxylase, partial [Streptomyces rimosus]|uniref:pyridoxal-dependent decarboxylase n=1 Tax=Streptomyces rimosus TaxID=1927 RepID=UPI0006C5F150
PVLVCATAGTTDTGAIDPLPALADLADTHGARLHVDAAYGGPLLFSDTPPPLPTGPHPPHTLHTALTDLRHPGTPGPPVLVCATAGTTDTGAIDPLPALAHLADTHGARLHVD